MIECIYILLVFLLPFIIIDHTISAPVEAEVMRRMIDMSLQDQWHNVQDIKKIPTDADILIAYATVPGTVFSATQ